jgi:transglutaminase-like putative cysteine protease
MHLKVLHTTTYTYSEKVSLTPQQILMRPRDGHTLVVRDFRLDVAPAAEVYWTRDHRDNTLAWVYFAEPTNTFTVRAAFDVETLDRNPFAFLLRLDAMQFPFEYTEAETTMLVPFLAVAEDRRERLARWLGDVVPEAPANTADYINAISAAIRTRLDYFEREEEGVQTPEATLECGSGTCRDKALLMMAICRSLGIATRFVSGYLYDPTVEAGRSAGSLHAWVEVFLPGAGWKGYDPTHAAMADEHFIPVAAGRRPENLNPVTGSFFGSKTATATMHTTLEITPH